MPDDPAVANTYYSQFDEFEEDKDSSGEIIESNVKVIHHSASNQRVCCHQGFTSLLP